MINIGILLDVCGICYTGKQLSKLEKLVNDLVQQHIENILKEFSCEDNSENDLKKLKRQNVIESNHFIETIKTEDNSFAEINDFIRTIILKIK